MSLALLFPYLMLNMFRMLIHPSSGAYVVVWLRWCGIWMQAEACIRIPHHTTPPQPNHTVTPTHIVPEQYNPWNNSTNKSQAPEDGCINIRNMLSVKWGNKKASTIKLVYRYSITLLFFVFLLICCLLENWRFSPVIFIYVLVLGFELATCW